MLPRSRRGARARRVRLVACQTTSTCSGSSCRRRPLWRASSRTTCGCTAASASSSGSAWRCSPHSRWTRSSAAAADCCSARPRSCCLVADLAYGAPIPTWNVSRTPRARHLSRRSAARHRRVLPAPSRECGREPLRQGGTVLADPARSAAVLHGERAQEPRLGDPGARRQARRSRTSPSCSRPRGCATSSSTMRSIGRKGRSRPGCRSRCSHDSATHASSRSSRSPAISRPPCTTRQARVAAAMGIPAPSARILGDGFNEPERFEGRDWRWLVQDGVVEVDVTEPGRAVRARSRSPSAPTASGASLSSIRTAARSARLRSEPPSRSSESARSGFPKGRSRLRLAVTPPPEQLGANDPRYGSIFLSPVEIRPLADYSRG